MLRKAKKNVVIMLIISCMAITTVIEAEIPPVGEITADVNYDISCLMEDDFDEVPCK